MPADPTPDDLTRFVRACDPRESLPPNDPRYVNLDDVRGENLVIKIARALRRADPAKPDVKLFAGHRGIGKTSELLRLKQELERQTDQQPAMQVIYVDIADSLDLNDLDFPDLLVFTADQVIVQLREAKIPGFDPYTEKIKSVWNQLVGLLGSEVTLSQAELNTGFGSLTLEIRNRPTARAKLREKIEQMGTPLIDAVNDLLGYADSTLRKSNRGGLVLIIDGLDKVALHPLDNGSTTHDRLFIDRSEQLGSLKAHVVYTVPISLIYSTQCARLEQSFGEFNVPMPMIRLHGREDADVRPDSPGMLKLREIIEKRCAYARISPDALFDDRFTSDYLCRMSGGHPRHLMMFLNMAADEVDALPITKAAAERAVRNYANSLLREVPDGFWPLLRRFSRPQTDIPKDPDHQQMLFLLHVFEYMNGEPWYEVNPVLRTLAKFEDASRGG